MQIPPAFRKTDPRETTQAATFPVHPTEALVAQVTHGRGIYSETLGRKADIFDEPSDGDYVTLRAIMALAMVQACEGKGKERHAGTLPFELQPMQTISQMLGSEHGLVFQAIKKANEGMRLPTDRKVAELLGAINYLAGAVLFIQRNEVSDDDGEM